MFSGVGLDNLLDKLRLHQPWLTRFFRYIRVEDAHFLVIWLGSGAICPGVRAKKRRAVFFYISGYEFPATKNHLGSFVV